MTDVQIDATDEAAADLEQWARASSPEQPRLEVWEDNGALMLANNWRHAVGEMFGHPLETLHEWPHLDTLPADVNRDEDQKSSAHAQFYRLFPRCEELFRFTAMELGRRALGDRPFVVQRVPTFRVHFPRSRAVGEPHTDWQYGHQPGELTFWIPLTRAFGSSTMWVAERAEGWDTREFARQVVDQGGEKAFENLPGPIRMFPVNLELGQLLVWDSVTRAHGNLLNREGLEEKIELDLDGETKVITAADGAQLVELLGGQALKVRRTWWEGMGITRVSIDFRVLPTSLLERETDRHTVNTGAKMNLGTDDEPGYWTDPETWI